ncbi:MAG: Aldose 1-epimerase, partial [uncultured Blastococcus sp.]
ASAAVAPDRTDRGPDLRRGRRPRREPARGRDAAAGGGGLGAPARLPGGRRRRWLAGWGAAALAQPDPERPLVVAGARAPAAGELSRGPHRQPRAGRLAAVDGARRGDQHRLGRHHGGGSHGLSVPAGRGGRRRPGGRRSARHRPGPQRRGGAGSVRHGLPPLLLRRRDRRRRRRAGRAHPARSHRPGPRRRPAHRGPRALRRRRRPDRRARHRRRSHRPRPRRPGLGPGHPARPGGSAGSGRGRGLALAAGLHRRHAPTRPPAAQRRPRADDLPTERAGRRRRRAGPRAGRRVGGHLDAVLDGGL